jgi:hypothetical protein
MTYFVLHRYGASEPNPPLSSLPALLDELEDRLEDEEHSSVSVVHESEWALTINRGGYVSYENVEADSEPRHMPEVSRSKMLELMEHLALGKLAELEQAPWLEGY